MTRGRRFIVSGLKGKKIIQGDIYKLKAVWQRPLRVKFQIRTSKLQSRGDL